ncbi:MAG: hypothetical protein ACXVDD_26395 [Polyangia bacterium]
MIRLSLALVFLAAVGCGNSSPGGGGGSGGTGGGGGSGGSSGIPDLSMPADLANAFMCGGSICTGSQQCCVTGMTPTCASSCGDGGFQAQCNGPANCGGNPCCITIGSGFTVQGVVCTTSASACPPMVNAQTQSGMDRACHVDADCVAGLPSMPAPQLPDCCTNTQTAQHVCFNKSYLQLPGITGWTCP